MTTARVYKRADGDWDFHFVAENGEIIGGSLQGFTERNDCVEGLTRLATAITEGFTLVLEDGEGNVEAEAEPDPSE